MKIFHWILTVFAGILLTALGWLCIIDPVPLNSAVVGWIMLGSGNVHLSYILVKD